MKLYQILVPFLLNIQFIIYTVILLGLTSLSISIYKKPLPYLFFKLSTLAYVEYTIIMYFLWFKNIIIPIFWNTKGLNI